MYKERCDLYAQLEKRLDAKVITYITSDRANAGAVIAQDAIDLFIKHLDEMGSVPKISLYLYTRGGSTSAAWNIVNLIRQYCDELQVIIPRKAHSSGTIISIGANSIIMSKQATLGPIDPSINSSLNPVIPNSTSTCSVSVEAVRGYMDFAKEELGIKDVVALSNIYIKLSEFVHPLVLGDVYRTKAQIKMLAEKLLINQVQDKEKVQSIISFLCSDSGSHDYTINSYEAKHILGLNVLEVDEEIDEIIQAIYVDFSDELELSKPFMIRECVKLPKGQYSFKRGFIESIKGGSYYFSTEGMVAKKNPQIEHSELADTKFFEGWKKCEEKIHKDVELKLIN